ncbi:MAG: hypothetical protein RLP02_19855 [Coleofasciculus sp. C2-GNP5-27]
MSDYLVHLDRGNFSLKKRSQGKGLAIFILLTPIYHTLVVDTAMSFVRELETSEDLWDDISYVGRTSLNRFRLEVMIQEV